MAQTNEILSPDVMSELQGLVDKLVEVKTKIADVNGQTISIAVDLKGAESLTRLLELTERQQVAIAKLNEVKQESITITQQLSQAESQYGTAAIGSIQQLAQAKLQLKSVQEEMRGVSRALLDGTGNMERLEQRFTRLTAEEAKLRIQINGMNKEFRDANVTINNTANSFNILGLSSEQLTRKMSYMLLSFVGWSLILGPMLKGVNALIESFSKLSIAEQEAADTLKQYQDNAKALGDFQGNINSGVEINKTDYESQIAVIRDKTASIEAQTEAYNNLKSTLPGVTNIYSQADIASGKDNDNMRKKANYIIDLINNLKQNKSTYEQELKDFSKLEKQYLLGDPDPTNRTIAHQNEQKALTEAYVSMKQDLATRRAEIVKNEIALQEANPSAIKTKKPTKEHKEFEDEINLEKQHYEIAKEMAQREYDLSRKTFTDKEKLDEREKEAAQEHYDNLLDIINRWHSKVGESEARYQARLAQAKADELAVQNAANEDERRIAQEIQKRHDEANKQIDEYIAKLEKQREEMRKVEQELNRIKADAATDHAAAQGFGGFLSAFGFDNEFAGSISKINGRIDDAKANKAALFNQYQEEASNANHPADPLKLGEIMKQRTQEDINLEQLKADKQKLIDDKILQAKEDISNKTIELAQQTFEAIKTIQDNQFAFEQQQIEIKLQQTQLLAQQQMDAIDATAGFQIQKDNEKAKVAAQTAAKENDLQKQSEQLQLKKARADKQYAEMKILADTATGIMKVWAEYGDMPAIAGALTAVIAGIGAAEYAAAASAPLPQFAGGTLGTTTRYFIAGEKGAELGTTPSGKKVLFERPGIYEAPIGTKIDTAEQTRKMINTYSMGMGYNSQTLEALREQKEQAMTDKRIVEELQELRSDVISAAMIGRVIKNEVKVNIGNEKQRPR